MKRSRGIAIAGGLALAGLLAFSGTRWREAREAEQRADAAEQRRRLAETELRRAEEAAAAQEAKAHPRRAAAAPAAAESPPPASATTPAIRRPAPPSFAERLRTEPETQALWVKSRRHEVAATYGPFLRRLGLPPEIQARFEALALQRDEKEMDLQAVATTQGLKPGDPVLQTLRRDALNDYEAGMKSLLGDDGYREYKEFERFSEMREMVNGVVGGSVMVAREPLTTYQAEQLIQIMANASPRFRNGGHATAWDLNWDIIDPQAQAILTPAQFAFFSQTEPPLPLGARFQARLYQNVAEAKRRDADAQRNSGATEK